MKILADTPRVRFGIQIYTLTPTNTLVEILRRRVRFRCLFSVCVSIRLQLCVLVVTQTQGDVLDFVRIYQAVSDAITKKCKA